MKTIQVIDGADNCAYDCFLASDGLFAAIFPENGQNVEFIEDFRRREGGKHDAAFSQMWKRRLVKNDIRGIDGTLFYELEHKKQYYPNKRDSDLDGSGRKTMPQFP